MNYLSGRNAKKARRVWDGPGVASRIVETFTGWKMGSSLPLPVIPCPFSLSCFPW